MGFRILVILKSALLALFFMSAASTVSNSVLAQQEAVQFASEPLTIKKAKGATHSFTVELATTEDQREYGLMFRKVMPPDHGMLFVFEKMRDIMMWMENTPLPLDMLFLDADGKITHIQENAVPYSKAIINSAGPVKYVIELNGGIVKKLGLSVGDKASSATIAKR